MRARALSMAVMLSLFSLTGCSGDAGPTGSRGSPGTDGVNGINGPPGVDGINGENGENGAPGEVITEIPLFGETFYPEGVASSADGTLYVGSVGTGQVVRIDPGSAKAKVIIDGGMDTFGAVGMIVDEATNTLWRCSVDLNNFVLPSSLKSYSLADAMETGDYEFPAGGFCNDVAIDDKGNVYATDSFFGVIRRLPMGGAALEEWSADPSFLVPAGEFGLNGIVWDGATLFAVNAFNGDLYRIAINGDGSSGAVTSIVVDKPLLGPDGMKSRAPNVLVIVDNSGVKVTSGVRQVIVTGDTGAATTLRNGLDQPTTGALADGDMWVAEGQFDHLFGTDPNPPDLPFMVRRVYLPPMN